MVPEQGCEGGYRSPGRLGSLVRRGGRPSGRTEVAQARVKKLNLPQAFLFIYYGLILQAEDNSITVRTHLRTLLDTSHQWPKQREVRPQPLGPARGCLTLTSALA